MRTIIGLDGREHKWNWSNKPPKKRNDVSKYHKLARQLISKTYPSYLVYEELPLPGSRKPGKGFKLFMDFYIPGLNLAIEVHGRQHYEFVPFFHKTKRGFAQALNRDDDKKEWCEINGIDLIELSYLETEDDWTYKLTSRSSS